MNAINKECGAEKKHILYLAFDPAKNVKKLLLVFTYRAL